MRNELIELYKLACENPNDKDIVQDTNALILSAKIGKPDTNGLVWDTWWVSN